MSFPRYPKYKPSGVEWLGDVPEHWEVKPLKAISSHNDEVLDEVTAPDAEITYVDISSVDEVRGIHSKEAMLFGAAPSRARRRVRHGDVIVSTVRTYLRAIARILDPEENLIVSTGFAVIRPRHQLHPAFAGYVLSAAYFVEQVITRSSGVSYPAINAGDLVGIPVTVPPIVDQIRIAGFLDRETAKIDGLIEEQRRLIDLLKEKRQAVISHAVTRGINPNAPSKRSGVQWLGEIPAHWGICQSRRMFKVRSEPAFASDRMLTASQKYGVLFQSDFVELEGRRVVEVIMGVESLKHVEPDDFIISMRSFQGGIEWCRLRGSTSFHYVMLTPVKWVHPPYFAHLFKSLTYIQALRTTTDLIRDGQELRYSNFVQVALPVIPMEEQVEIATFLNDEISKLDTLAAEAQCAIDLFQERRSALISAAVTGQIDVRGAVVRHEALGEALDLKVLRAVLAAEILTICNPFGDVHRVKLQKLIHLAEYQGELAEIKGDYERQAYGPFDEELMKEVAAELRARRWFDEKKVGDRFIYTSLEKAGQHVPYLAAWEEKLSKIRKPVELMKTFSTPRCERISTLYAAWNDLLLKGSTFSDDQIVREASDPTRWHEHKADIPPERWAEALQWMKDNDVVPKAFGMHTRGFRMPRRNVDRVGTQPQLL